MCSGHIPAEDAAEIFWDKGEEVTAEELVSKMFDDYTMKTGKPPSEVKLAPRLYDSLVGELRKKAVIPNDHVVDYVKFKGIFIERAES